MFSFFYIFFVTGIRQSLVAEARKRVATRLTLSGRLQTAGDQDVCSAARSSVDPVMNQAGLEWRIETKDRDIRKKDMFQTRIV